MSLFKRPAWAQTRALDHEGSEGNIFSHSHKYDNIVAQEQRKKKDKLERQKPKQERRISDKQKIKDERDGGTVKRRRITLEEGVDLLREVGLFPIDLEQQDGEAEEEEVIQDIARRTSPRFKMTAEGDRMSPPVKQPAGVDFGDDDEFNIVQSNVDRADEPQEESDDEFAELVKQARERRQRKEQQVQMPKAPHFGAISDFESSSIMRKGFSRPPPPDPTVQLFISSRIPGTDPLIVHRKLSQRLLEIRKVWCSKQDFSEEFTKGVYLVHRMRKVYDVTTCKSLGLDIDAEGNVTMKGAEGKEGLDKVHLEAVTDEIFAQLKAEKEREEREKQGGGEDEDAQTGAGAQEASNEESLIRVFFKAKGRHEPFKLKVKPATKFSKIMAVCRNHFEVCEDQSLFLEFDGERLNSDDEVQSTEISDMDVVDVHVG